MRIGLAVVGAAAAEHDAVLERVRHRLRPGSVKDRGRAGLGREAAEPVEPGRGKLRVLVAEEWIERYAALDQADHQTILGRDVEQPVCRLQTAAPRHVLHQNCRLARNMTAEMGGKGPGVEVVAAADVRGSDQPYRLAAIEFLATGGPSHGRKGHQSNERPQHSRSPSTADIDKASRRYETRGRGRNTHCAALWGNPSLSPADGSRH